MQNLPLIIVCIFELLGLVVLGVYTRRLQAELAGEKDKFSQLQQKLEFQALYDPLTQLPNRRLFRDRLLQTIKTYNRTKTRFGVLMGDLDHFKIVNDTMGHDTGDLLLIEVANRLRRCIRESDTLARLGGDEFALICPSVQDMSSASIICMRLIEALREPVVIKGKPFTVGISLGIALFPEHATDEEMLVRRADTAMYRAKQKRNSFVMYNSDIDRPRQTV